MRIIDISKEMFSADVYPGDPTPQLEWKKHIGENGSQSNFSVLTSGSHAATHLDAPYHFVNDGCTMEAMPLERFYGPCVVASAKGRLTAEETKALLKPSCTRLLLHGDAEGFFTAESAAVLEEAGVELVGTDSQTIGDGDAHRAILGRKIAVLEGLSLAHVPDGSYTLVAFPLKMDGVEATFTRAVLLQEE